MHHIVAAQIKEISGDSDYGNVISPCLAYNYYMPRVCPSRSLGLLAEV